jgi:endonuclease III
MKKIEVLLKNLGKTFSQELDINLKDKDEIFKWFLASILFGARISETIVLHTYKEFEKEKVLTPEKILSTGWDGLVKILDDGGYVRYDFKTATKLLEIMRTLKERYQGDLNRLHSQAKDERDLERRIRELGKGIGEVTTNIFLRELRGIWEKADPLLGKLVIQAAKNLGLTKESKPSTILRDLKRIAPKGEFVSLEAALVRLGKDFCKKNRCRDCPLRKYCERNL